MLWAGNSVKNWRISPISNPIPDFNNIDAHTKFGENPLTFIYRPEMKIQMDVWQTKERPAWNHNSLLLVWWGIQTNKQTVKSPLVKNHRIYFKIIWQKCSVCGPPARLFKPLWGWVDRWGVRLGLANMCILHHKGIQLRLAYSWARPAIFIADKSRWGVFLFLLFLHFHSCSLSSLSLSVPLSFSPFL